MTSQVNYSLLDLIAHGLVIDDLTIVRPIVRLRRDASGWNVSRLVKEQATEADREGPGRPIQISRIGIAGGLIEIDNRAFRRARRPRGCRAVSLDSTSRAPFRISPSTSR